MPTVYEAFETALDYHHSGRLAEAEQIYREIIARVPGHADALHMLGAVALASGRPQESIALVRRAIGLVPGQPAFHSNLGEAHRALGQLDEARACFEEALRLDASFVEAHNNLGLVLQARGDVAGARRRFERAISLRPDHVEAHYNLSRILLLTGDFERGWKEYAWRERMRGHASQRLGLPQWDGKPPGKLPLLLYAEQGLGDTLQFIRYVPLAQARAAHVVVAVPPVLVPLLAASGYKNLVSQPGPLEDYAAQSSLLGLPGVFRTTLDTIPRQVPYLRADASLVERWRAALDRVAGLKVGIAWQGNRAFPSDRFRSIPLFEFEPLAKVPRVQLVSLQTGDGQQQLASLGRPFDVLSFDGLDADGAFMETAAIMTSLDLVVTSDTSIAHLAGGLGVPAWVALPLSPDWRWLLNRTDCPWYPTMRLFRQSRLGVWSDVFTQMAAALAASPPRRTPA